MADLKGRFDDAKDKVEGTAKEAQGKVTDDKGKELEGKAQSTFADVKDKARDAGDDLKEGAEKLTDKVKEGFEDLKDKFYEHHQWIESHLDEDYYDRLNELPRVIEKTFNQKKVLFIHYEIPNEQLTTPIDGQPYSPIVEPSEENIKALFEDKQADLIVFGHNHTVHLYDDKSTVYFNPGSVGLNNGAYAVYGIVTIDENEFSIERVKVPYDNEEFIRGFDEKQVPATALIFDKFL